MLKRQITIRLESETIAYFKKLAKRSEIPYQSLINMYLKECVQSHKKPVFKWAA
ncbi:MAG: BrnA antitoxin family protein [Deltaproteobacteria bacterium]|nr:BrnA antitoxin family protein [Deltaproteobacteria bacterium]